MTSASVILQSYLLCSLIGFAFVYAFDYAQWVMIAAFVISFFLMLVLECLHPPAIMLPIMIISERLRDYTLAFDPIAIDVLILLVAVYFFNKTLEKFPLIKKWIYKLELIYLALPIGKLCSSYLHTFEHAQRYLK